jgi:hypothetical protein
MGSTYFDTVEGELIGERILGVQTDYRVDGIGSVTGTIDPSATAIATYLYMADGLKRLELVDGAPTTLIWDGQDYLGELH